MRTPSQRRRNFLLGHTLPLPSDRQLHSADAKRQRIALIGRVKWLDGVNVLEIETDATTLCGEGEGDLGECGPSFREEGLVFEEEVLGLGLGLEGLAHGLFTFLDGIAERLGVFAGYTAHDKVKLRLRSGKGVTVPDWRCLRWEERARVVCVRD